ncbi:hypothetical protein FEM48_Zijuj01G0183200 [Ziziphus jujuba var. spinosa]|uniref:Serine-rich protein-like protein n=1 Tax=Ziziphus jujuba var. spinosa TaxID=714518 RepID=A0A978W2U3_ZIZJJ|nr:hypothetical protein FEM48_Zijuj01G0183200 [Ziziphus jujuba var. spinosa]
MATKVGASNPKSHSSSRSCLCSPTNHPGSFRCSLHRNSHKATAGDHQMRLRPSSNNVQWDLAILAKANSIKEFILRVIKPSSHDIQRRRNFQPNKPTRFCLMNNNREVAVS